MHQTIRYKIALLTACAVLPVTGLFAQAPAATDTAPVSTPAPTATPDATPTAGRHHSGRRARLAALTSEERQQLKAAHDKALQDPAVKSAEATRATDKKGYRKAVREAMLRADPSIQPILEKTREGRRHAKNDTEG